VSTIKAYRVTHNDYRESAFSGEGARLHGGRWNEKGSPVVYLSSDPALAVLEVLVHLEDDEELDNFCMYEVELSEEQIFIIQDELMPENWKEYPAPSSTVSFGQTWIESQVSLAMRVPSVTLSYASYNYVLNVNHAQFHMVANNAILIPLDLDSRLKS